MTHHERDDRQALAAGETYLIHVLETSDPPGNPDHYRITDAVEAHHASTGSYDVEAGSLDAARDAMAHAGVTAAEVAQSIAPSLAKAAISAVTVVPMLAPRVNG